MNQGLIRFRGPAGDPDSRTDAIIAAVQAEGTTWFVGTTWHGVRAIRVHRTTDADVDRAVEAVARVL